MKKVTILVLGFIILAASYRGRAGTVVVGVNAWYQPPLLPGILP